MAHSRVQNQVPHGASPAAARREQDRQTPFELGLGPPRELASRLAKARPLAGRVPLQRRLYPAEYCREPAMPRPWQAAVPQLVGQALPSWALQQQERQRFGQRVPVPPEPCQVGRAPRMHLPFQRAHLPVEALPQAGRVPRSKVHLRWQLSFQASCCQQAHLLAQPLAMLLPKRRLVGVLEA